MRTCTICSHGERGKIEAAIVRRTSLRDIAGRFGSSKSAIERHQKQCVGVMLAAQRKVTDQQLALDIDTQLQKTFARINKLFDACDDWLKDPNNPERYTLLPRASEITVVYEEAEELQGGGVKWVKRTASLQDLIDTQANGHQLTASARMRHGDPRELVTIH